MSKKLLEAYTKIFNQIILDTNRIIIEKGDNTINCIRQQFLTKLLLSSLCLREKIKDCHNLKFLVGCLQIEFIFLLQKKNVIFLYLVVTEKQDIPVLHAKRCHTIHSQSHEFHTFIFYISHNYDRYSKRPRKSYFSVIIRQWNGCTSTNFAAIKFEYF